jgi:hypothetical protein
MTVNKALKLAIGALHKEYRYWVCIADSSAGDKKCNEIKEAIKILLSMIVKEK